MHLFAGMSLDEKLLDATTLTIVGMGTVLVCLWLIGDIFNVMRKMFGPKAAAAPAAAASAAAPAKPQAAGVPGIEAHLVPLITAAATAALGRRVIVHRITFINSNTVSGWAEAGRTSIHQSHNLRRN
jgi:Na+-transporting methylmalonyl-CoA/oxaloacetate decarboxylase gamma subunit